MYEAIQVLANFDLAASISFENDDTLNGSFGDDFLRSYTGNDLISGNGGNDTLDGGAGTDTAIYSGNQASHTLTLSPTTTTIIDRRADGNGTDTLIDMEFLDFDTDTFDLTQFGGTTGLSEENFESFIELYIARLQPGTGCGGSELLGHCLCQRYVPRRDGHAICRPRETEAAYPPGTSNELFAETVYNNVLGRTPDQAGVDFWVGQLDEKTSAETSSSWRCCGACSLVLPTDLTWITSRSGAYFAVHKGMSDTGNAAAAWSYSMLPADVALLPLMTITQTHLIRITASF